MKKLLALLLCFVFCLSLASCKGKTDTTSSGEETDSIPYNYNLAEYITLGEYLGITYTPLSTAVTDDGVWQYIVSVLQEAGMYEEEKYPDLVYENLTEGTVRYGDLVTLNIETEANGVAVANGTGNSLATEIGGNFFTANITEEEAEQAGFAYDFLTQFLTEIEEEAVGKEIGTPFTLSGTFPEDNFENGLEGQSYVITVTVNTVAKRYGHPDALTSDDIALFGDYETQDDLFEYIEEELNENGLSTAQGEIWHYITYAFRALGYYNTTLYRDYFIQNLTAGTVQDGDTVYISYEGKMDGKAVSSATSEGTSLVIGSGDYIDGFETGLIDCEIGKSVTLNLAFPENYEVNPDFSGKDVVFDVTVHLVTKRYNHPDVIPENIMQELYEYEYADSVDFDAFWEKMKQEKIAELEEEAETSKENQVVSKIKSSTTLIAYPEKEVAEYIADVEEQFTTIALYYGCENLETYVTMCGMTLDEFNEQARLAAEEEVFTMMIIYQIARTEGFDKLDEAEYEKYVENLGGDSTYAELCEEYGTEYVKQQIY